MWIKFYDLYPQIPLNTLNTLNTLKSDSNDTNAENSGKKEWGREDKVFSFNFYLYMFDFYQGI